MWQSLQLKDKYGMSGRVNPGHVWFFSNWVHWDGNARVFIAGGDSVIYTDLDNL